MKGFNIMTLISSTRFFNGALLAGAMALISTEVAVAQPAPGTADSSGRLVQTWDKTFPRSEKVDHQKVTFKNRYGITLAADVYLPKDRGNKKLAALVISGPFGAVKEQASGLYAQTLAERGFVTLAFDPSYKLKGGEAQFLVDYADYYMTKRGYHPRAVNSGNSWSVTTPMAFMNFPLMTYIKEISPRPILFIHGEKAHSLYFSKTAYEAANQPKELLIVKNATHVDLYDRMDKIPFDNITAFFNKNLNK
ncbi:TPA: alpha/beta hydrolase [Klebsiella pneumoniae]|nr:alpha/beta hydrolase [Klebsiella pneumoniae]HCT1994915.1 alpha/beta hydrolase [Klebsiella pneumoniae]HCT2614505.1 alpha/beta hydrolase [Klebsiella pneumoniae]